MRDVELELEAELREVMKVLARSDLESEAEVFASPVTAASGGPIFEVACAGCAAGQCVACPDGLCAACPVHGGGCRAVVRQAIIEAIKLARNAAGKIDAAISVEPSKRGKDAKETARLFQFFFCHDPSLVIPCAGGPSGVTVAQRLRAVAGELGVVRWVFFAC